MDDELLNDSIGNDPVDITEVLQEEVEQMEEKKQVFDVYFAQDEVLYSVNKIHKTKIVFAKLIKDGDKYSLDMIRSFPYDAAPDKPVRCMVEATGC